MPWFTYDCCFAFLCLTVCDYIVFLSPGWRIWTDTGYTDVEYFITNSLLPWDTIVLQQETLFVLDVEFSVFVLWSVIYREYEESE